MKAIVDERYGSADGLQLRDLFYAASDSAGTFELSGSGR